MVPEPTFVQRRPTKSEDQPAITAPTAAPIRSELTTASCSNVDI
jgi:hypothetical protein